LLQQKFAIVVEQEQRKSPVQNTMTVMALGLGKKAGLVIVRIDENQLLCLR
jgi:hypothetical protein